MSVTYHLLNLPATILLVLVLTAFAGLSVAATYSFHKYARTAFSALHTEATGHVYGLLGSIYGLLLGFVAVLIWGGLQGYSTNAAKEESLAGSLYSEINYFPDKVKAAPLRSAF